ncbi:MAG: DNA recombination protein RmuC [Synergistes sp.]|nr:DNA recombination protein RmuC [Synergistes sp.]
MLYIICGVSAAAIVAVSIYILITLSKVSAAADTSAKTVREISDRMHSAETRLDETVKNMNDGFAAMRREEREAAAQAREELSRGIKTFGDSQAERVKEIGAQQTESLSAFSRQIAEINRLTEEKLETMRTSLENSLRELHKSSEEKLEKMRVTVDEELHSALEKRLGEAFTNVSQRLEQVHKGLGEMKALTSDVGDLKKVLSNVKVRGTWGEMQLGKILEEILAKEQYAENVATRPKSSDRVEFAILLPGKDENENVMLPIDAKFPMEDYKRLIEASDEADKEKTAAAQKALRQRILDEAKTIHEKYIEVPYTTDFGILYLPIESLYAEVLRIDGLCERIMREYRVVPAGPATICALLNSLQMGFRTLAIEKRSGEVWQLLGKVKTEFEKFGESLDKTKQRIEQAGKELDELTGKRTNAIKRALKNVEKIPTDEGQFLADEEQ